MVCELPADRNLDLIREPSNHLAEGPDFLVAKPSREHQIRRVPKGSRAAFVSSTRDRVIEVSQKRIRLTHF
jgi:hypothetical protein